MEQYWYFGLGFLAQGLFSARMLVQWILSEKSKKVVSPMIYWQLSLLASFLLYIYGWLREDFSIILGQIISYYIYIWNIDIKGGWKSIHPFIRFIICITPVAVFSLFLFGHPHHAKELFNDNIPLGLIVFGSLGQIIFVLRFVYQWWYSRQKGESLLPAMFWVLSLVGSFCIVLYGIFRKDPVLIIGQGAGFITYSRNLFINRKRRHEDIDNR